MTSFPANGASKATKVSQALRTITIIGVSIVVVGVVFVGLMELFYLNLRDRKKSNIVGPEDFTNGEAVVDQLIDEVFIRSYHLQPGKPVEYEGQRLVVREVVKRFARRILEMDKTYAPFEITILEEGGLEYLVPIERHPGTVLLSGKIDRVDRKGDLIRVIDYKTGRDKLDFDSVASLFNRDRKRNKAVFQILLYALLYKTNAGKTPHKIVAGLINRMNLFDKDFRFGITMGRKIVEDVEPLLPEFDQHLKMMLNELFDPNVPFDQTTDTELCRYCSFRGICYR